MIAPYSDAFADLAVARRWLADRVAIFRSICVPGLNLQSYKPDAVLLGYADGLYAEANMASSLLDASLSPTPVYQLRSDTEFEEITQVFKTGVLNSLKEDHTHVISIRLDNDDAIHKDYVMNIVEHFRIEFEKNPNATDFFASYPFGMQADAENLYAFIYPNGPFQARMEACARPLKGIYAINHTKVLERKNFSLIVKNTPYWIQYVHGGNVSNNVKVGSLRLTKDNDIMLNFGLSTTSFCINEVYPEALEAEQR